LTANPFKGAVLFDVLFAGLLVFAHDVSRGELEDPLILLGQPDSVVLTAAQFTQLSPEMQGFVDQHVNRRSCSRQRLNQLYRAVFDPNALGFKYDENLTLSAPDAFEMGSGNCLSFSAMFVAMARYAEFDAAFQELVGPAQTDSETGTKRRRRHINVLVRLRGTRLEIDFPRTSTRCATKRVLTDESALAHFYNNRAIQALRSGELTQAGRLAGLALYRNHDFARAWVTLGVCQRVRGDYRAAKQAYEIAIELNPKLIPAIHNLAHLYFYQGQYDQAEQIFDQVVRSKRDNPFRAFNRAVHALKEKDLERASAYLERAKQLEPAFPAFERTFAEFRVDELAAVETYAQLGFRDADNPGTLAW